MAITGDMIRQALATVGAVGRQHKSFDQLAREANQALGDVIKAGQAVTAQGAANFLANCAVESAYFRTTREYGGANTRYAPYYGRGYIQVTWRENYANFGKWCARKGLLSNPNAFVNSPDRLAEDKWAWLGALWYFETCGGSVNLWPYANKGDALNVGIAINRGPGKIGSGLEPYGWGHRLKMYHAFLKFGNALLPEVDELSAEDVKAIRADIATLAKRVDALAARDDSKAWANFAVERGGKKTTRSVRQAILYGYEFGERNNKALKTLAASIKALSAKVGAGDAKTQKELDAIGADVAAIEKQLDG